MRMRRDSGFTLIELLVALALLALAMVVIPSTIRLANRAVATSSALIEGTDDRHELAFLESSLAEAMPLIEQGEEGNLRIAFAGTAESMSFLAPVANGPAGGGVYRIRLDFTGDGSVADQALSLRMWAHGSGGADDPALEERSLARGLSAGAFRYFGTPAGRPAPEWSSAWTRTDRLPDLVEIVTATGPEASRVRRVELRLRRRN